MPKRRALALAAGKQDVVAHDLHELRSLAREL